MTERAEFESASGDAFRLMCPGCKSTWTTYRAPCECPTCGSLVTFRIIRRPHGEDQKR